MAVSKRLRYEILRRDNHTCRYCGRSAPDVELTVDHVIPTALGGTDEPTNLVTACADCNSGKTSSNPDAPLVDDVAQDALRWAAAIRTAADIQAARREERDDYASDFVDTWRSWTFGGGTATAPLPGDWKPSIHRFHDLDVDHATLVDAIEVAMFSQATRDNKFKYFCGVVWNIIHERREIATELLAAEDEPPPPDQTELALAAWHQIEEQQRRYGIYRSRQRPDLAPHIEEALYRAGGFQAACRGDVVFEDFLLAWGVTDDEESR